MVLVLAGLIAVIVIGLRPIYRDMALEDLIADLGYIAVFIGTFFEGETVLALGGVAAAHGYLSLPMVIGIAIIGGFLGDQTCFFIGRRYGTRILAHFPGLAA